MSIEEKIKELNIKLPDPKDPVGAYVASKIVGNLLYISGQISINDKGDLINFKYITKYKNLPTVIGGGKKFYTLYNYFKN